MLYITITLCLMFLFSGVLTLDLSSGLVREAHDSALISHVISPLNTYQDDESRQKLGSLCDQKTALEQNLLLQIDATGKDQYEILEMMVI